MNNQIQLVLKSSTTELSLNDHELGIYLVPELDGLTGLPEIRTTSGVNSGYDGGWTSAQHYDARSITIRGVIANTDVATVERLRKQLVSLAGQGKQEELTLDLVTEAGNAYTLQVRTIALEMAMKGVLEKQEFMLQLRADDPLIYDNAESTHEAYIQVSKATGGFTINFDLPLAITGGSEETVISNDGLEQVPTITRLYGELHNPKIINQTTNQSMQINADLGFSEGQWVDASEVVTGKTINIEDAPDNAPLASFRLDGETSQNGTPTPSAPVPVQTVTGENVVEICRKNFADSSVGKITQQLGASAAQSGNGFTVTGASSGGTHYVVLPIQNVEALLGKSVVASCLYTGDATRITVYYLNSSGEASSYVNELTLSSGSASKTFTMPASLGGNAGIGLVFYVGTNTSATFYNIQLELGSTATAYEPYQSQSYEVNLGKNLFDKDNANILSAYIDSGQQTITSNNNNRIIWIKCEPSTTYTITKTPANYQRGIAYTKELPTSGVQTYGYYSGTNNWENLSFTTGADAKYLVIRIWVVGQDSASLDNMLASVQIEKGSTATSYAAYFEPIELCKIGDYQDYIYKSGGKWYVRKETQKIIYNGQETWDSWFVVNNNIGFYHSDPSLALVGYETRLNGALYCDKLSEVQIRTNIRDGLSAGMKQCGGTGAQYIAIGIAKSELSDYSTKANAIASFKTWLASNNLTFYGTLATPTDTEITNEALIAQLETLLNTARTYAGVNNIFTVTPNEQGTLEVSYYTHKTADNRDEIVIDSRLRTVTLNGLDIYHLIETGSEFLMLAPGENKLSLQSDITGDNGYAEVSYKQGYLSI